MKLKTHHKVIVAVAIVAVLISSRSLHPKLSTPQNISKSDNSITQEKTPEQVLEEMDARENPESKGPLSAEIVSPEGDTFEMSQARLYRAMVENRSTIFNQKTTCHWKFYLNEYSEEVLYKEMDTPVTGDRCGFTSTFIDKRGKLRVVLEVSTVDTKTNETLESFTTEKNYLVD